MGRVAPSRVVETAQILEVRDLVTLARQRGSGAPGPGVMVVNRAGFPGDSVT